MAPARSHEKQFLLLKAIREAPEAHDLERELGPLLAHPSSHVLARAAATAGEVGAGALAPKLEEAFQRLLGKGPRQDPGCTALIAIAEALITLEEPAYEVFLAGIAHVQMEGSFGPPVDAAAPLRGLCARGLARSGNPDAMLHALTLLVDPWVPARVGAARALADSGRPEAELLLRLNVLKGDREPQVMGECFAALLALAPERSVPLVARYLGEEEEAVAEEAAIALGESHQPEAFPPLREASRRAYHGGFISTLLLAIAMLRSEAALAFLLETVAEAEAHTAASAVAALALYRHDEELAQRLRALVEKRGSAKVTEVWRSKWGA
jgi:HEAT repeat protein